MLRLQHKLLISFALIFIVGILLPIFIIDKQVVEQAKTEIGAKLKTHIDSFLLYYQTAKAIPMPWRKPMAKYRIYG